MVMGLFAFPGSKAYAASGAVNVSTSAYYWNYGWGNYVADNALVFRSGYYPTAVRFALSTQPEGMSGTLTYRVKVVGTDWLPECANNEQAGVVDRDAALIGLSMNLTGELGDHYDIQYKVLKNNGQWTDWARNGVPCTDGSDGTFILGVRASITEKGVVIDDSKMTVDPTRPMVALTFDDGPSSTETPKILAALESVGGRATFFVVGNRVPANAAVLQRAAADGCEIGNHTWNHETITKQSAEGLKNILNTTNDAVQNACGVRPVVMRPPGGAYNASSLAVVGDLGMSAYYWSIDPRDWKTRNAQSTIDAVLNNVKDGDIILMHDIYAATADAASVIIPELVNRGYQLVTVSEMAAARGGGVPGQIYFSLR